MCISTLDHFVVRELRPALYLRYVDDFVLFGNDKAELGAMQREIESLLAQLRLNLNPGKSRVYRCADGLSFLGWRLFPGNARLRRRNVVSIRTLQRWSGGLRLGWGTPRSAIPGICGRICSMPLHS